MRKKKLDKLIDEWFEEGLWACLNSAGTNRGTPWLEYGSVSGMYHLNPARRLAFKAGHKKGEELISRIHQNPAKLIFREYDGPPKIDPYDKSAVLVEVDTARRKR